jgi:hypothetical protein
VEGAVRSALIRGCLATMQDPPDEPAAQVPYPRCSIIEH